MRVVIFGAPGMVGQGVLRECLRDPHVTRVLAVGRRRVGMTHRKLGEQPGASAGLPGELWHGGKVPRFAEALRMPGVRLQLYGTPVPIIGRTMGHLSAVGATPDEAVHTVLRAAAQPADRTRRAIAHCRLLLKRRRPAQRGG